MDSKFKNRLMPPFLHEAKIPQLDFTARLPIPRDGDILLHNLDTFKCYNFFPLPVLPPIHSNDLRYISET